MYENEKQILTQFEDKLHELIEKYNKEKELTTQLTKLIEEKKDSLAELQARYDELEQNYINLKQARMISISYEEVDSAKEHIARLVREIDQCIDSLIKKQ
jgi:DNA repair exonuclease SbcCD ATPase subunit